MTALPTPGTKPENGVTRCPCGCKYWTDAGRCFDCGDLPPAPEPERPDWVADLNEPDEEEWPPTCSLCDGLGHGYPGAGPCPLEERGYPEPPYWGEHLTAEWN